MSRKLPKNVASIDIFRAFDGYRYTCRERDEDGRLRVVYDSERSFRTIRHARREIDLYWPEAKVNMT